MLTTTANRQDAPRAGRSDAKAYRIAVGAHSGSVDLTLPVSDTSCWGRVLGPFELPADEALDVLAAAAEAWTAPPKRIDLIGAPAACLLPVVWLRSIWLGPDVEIALRWPRVGVPGSDGREQLAAQLCASLVNELHCDEPGEASARWGIAPECVGQAGPEIFDLLLGVTDHWDIQHRHITDTSEWRIRAWSALEELRDHGRTKVAIYGAGAHTRSIGASFMRPPVEILCIIDDDELRHGERLWGFPVVSREQAIQMGVQAVMLSSNSHEDKLLARCDVFHSAGVEVVRLYADVFGG